MAASENFKGRLQAVRLGLSEIWVRVAYDRCEDLRICLWDPKP